MYNHLLYKGYDIKVGYYGDKEIDFIGEKNGEKLYIQVALKIDGDTAEREFGNLLKIQDNYPKIVLIQRKQLRGYTPLSYTPVLNGVNHTIYEK